MSGNQINLDTLSKRVDSNISKSTKPDYRFFKSKNQPTDTDIEAVSSYHQILGNFKKGVSTVSSFFQKNILSTNQPKANSSNQPFIHKPTLKRIPKLNAVPKLIERCEKCNCTRTRSGPCSYCDKSQEIQIVESDREIDKSIDLTMSTQSTQIPAAKFYSSAKENSSKLNTSSSFSSMIEDGSKYEIDYLYVGTHRFLSRTFIRICNDHLVLNLATKSSINIDYKLIVRLSICEHKNDNSKFIYIKIDFVEEAVDEINKYIDTLQDQNGSFKYESINGHEKYFIMKLKFIDSEETKYLKSKLKIFLQHRLRDDSSTYRMFEEQREYCLQTRNFKKQKTTDHRYKNQGKLSNSIIVKEKHEPMEIDRPNSSNSQYVHYRSSGYMTRSVATSENPSFYNLSMNRSPLAIKRTFGSSNSVKLFDQDDDEMEISEINKTSLSFKNIKNSKILYETGSGETMIILKTDLSCLNDGNFLNDKIIEFYLMHIKSKLIDQSVAKKTYIFSSFFFTKMLSLTKGSLSEEDYNELSYNSVKNWTKNVDIFEYDYLIVPIFRNSHWSLAIIVYPGKVFKDDLELILDEADDEKPAIIFMDSMGKKRVFHRYLKLLRNFLSKECTNKKSLEILFSSTQMSYLDPEVPIQLNGYDCGIFVLHYVELFLKSPSSIIQKCRLKKELQNWFSSSELKDKRSQIFNILSEIHDENLKNGIKFESEEDMTLKSDEEIEIINGDDKDNALLSDDDDVIS